MIAMADYVSSGECVKIIHNKKAEVLPKLKGELHDVYLMCTCEVSLFTLNQINWKNKWLWHL